MSFIGDPAFFGALKQSLDNAGLHVYPILPPTPSSACNGILQVRPHFKDVRLVQPRALLHLPRFYIHILGLRD